MECELGIILVRKEERQFTPCQWLGLLLRLHQSRSQFLIIYNDLELIRSEHYRVVLHVANCCVW